MTFIYGGPREKTLYHYGVKGMKWGKHRDYRRPNSRTASKEYLEELRFNGGTVGLRRDIPMNSSGGGGGGSVTEKIVHPNGDRQRSAGEAAINRRNIEIIQRNGKEEWADKKKVKKKRVVQRKSAIQNAKDFVGSVSQRAMNSAKNFVTSVLNIKDGGWREPSRDNRSAIDRALNIKSNWRTPTGKPSQKVMEKVYGLRK